MKRRWEPGDLSDIFQCPDPTRKRSKTDQNELLNVIFRFKHKTPATVKTELCAQRWWNISQMNPVTDDRIVPISVFSEHEVDQLREVRRRLEAAADDVHKRGDVWYDPWLPAYGCALQKTKVNAAVVKLELLFVDGWERTLHFLPTGECVHSAVPKTYHVLHCADLDAALEQKFTKTFDSKLQKAQQGKGSKRSAAINDLGHQKTPQFIAAVVRRAVAAVTLGKEEDDEEDFEGDKRFSPHGGTTDVGQHTGGRPRDTCWPLVHAAISRNLCCGQGLFRKTMTMFHLSLLQKAMAETQGAFRRGIDVKSGCDSVDDLFAMLQVAVKSLVELLDDGYDVSALQGECSALRANIDELVGELNRQSASQYHLPESTALQQLNALSSEVQIDSPKRVKELNGDEDMEERRRRALGNLDGCWFLDGATCSLQDLLEWEKTNSASNANKCVLVLRTVETFMFTRSYDLVGDDQAADDDNGGQFVEQMQSLVTAYQNAAATWRQLPRDMSVLDVEQRSRELLVLWIAFCLVHRRCVVDVPLCSEYNVALDWKDLKVAVLSERAAVSALQNVAGPNLWLRAEIRSGQQQHDGCIQPRSRKLGESRSKVVGRSGAEEELGGRDPRRDLASEEEIASKKRELADENNRLDLPSEFSNRVRESGVTLQLQPGIKKMKAEVKKKKQSLKRALETPPPLTRPLPAAKDDAIQVIFMLTMPRKLEILGNLCLTAQRALGPAEATTTMKALPQLSATTWQQFYDGYAPIRAISATTTLFTTTPGSFYLPAYGGPSTVDSLETISQYKAQCVVSPLLRGTMLTWKDSSGEVLNPFNVAPTSVIDSFIERIPEPFPHFQWMNAWPGQDDTRGNMVYAKAHQQPEDFEKAAFIALGSLRAFPNQQFRRLQWALLDDVLPWSHACVETIVRQALYQIGDLTDEAEPRLLWKTDMLRGDEGLKTFCATLETTAVKSEQTPRSFEDVPLLSELAGYQFTTEASSIVKLFARMARRWAADLRLKVEGERSPDRVITVRQKECVLYGYALLAFKLRPLDDEAAGEVCELIVLFRTSFLCASINTPSTEQMLRIESKVTEMMARRITEIIAYVERRGTDAVLTALVGLASATSPSRLQWKRVDEFSESGSQFGSCFETCDSRYAINLFSGIVLADGNAPGGLPSSIREHERFQSLFGQCNFEVISVGGAYQTESKYCDRLYEFELQEDEELLVQEIDVDSARNVSSTLQLCSASWIEAFSEQFPARLRELYSHWYWVERKCVLFRPNQAKCREVFYVATFDDNGALQCYQVPFSDTSLSYQSILANLDGYDRFVRKEE